MPGIWAIKPDGAQPKQLTGSIGASTYLSPDGTKLAWHDFNNSPEALVILDLASNQERRFPWLDSWRLISGWSHSGHVSLLISEMEREGSGITRQVADFDPSTQHIETSVLMLALPGYTFEENNPFGGYAAVDPTDSVVLYTAQGDDGIDTLLRDLHSKTELWRQKGVRFEPIFPYPAWTQDGSRVAFVPNPGYNDYTKLFALSRDGQQLEQLTQLPLADHLNYIVRDLHWSSDGRYLEYALWKTISEGPGFILDTHTSLIREFCHADDTFLSGQWLPDTDLFVYRVRRADNQEELRLLDVSAWHAQGLAVAKPGSEINVVGWTPLLVP